jgi:hypothetical protein
LLCYRLRDSSVLFEAGISARAFLLISLQLRHEQRDVKAPSP